MVYDKIKRLKRPIWEVWQGIQFRFVFLKNLIFVMSLFLISMQSGYKNEIARRALSRISGKSYLNKSCSVFGTDQSIINEKYCISPL